MDGLDLLAIGVDSASLPLSLSSDNILCDFAMDVLLLVGVVGRLSISVFVGVASVGNDFLLAPRRLLVVHLIVRGETYRGAFTRVFLRLAGEFRVPEPGTCTRLLTLVRK